MAHGIRPFHSALEYLVSLSQVVGARRAPFGACPAGGPACPGAVQAREMLDLHREREQQGFESDTPHARGPFGLADLCGFHILELRALAYIFLNEGTVPSVPVFLDQAEMVRLIAEEGSEAGTLVQLLDEEETLQASGCVQRLRVGQSWMLALTDRGRAAFVHGRLSESEEQRRAKDQLQLPLYVEA